MLRVGMGMVHGDARSGVLWRLAENARWRRWHPVVFGLGGISAIIVVALAVTAAIVVERVVRRIITRGTTGVVSILAGLRTTIVTKIDIHIDVDTVTDVGIDIVTDVGIGIGIFIEVGISIGAGTDIISSVHVIGIEVVAVAKAKGLVVDVRRPLAIAFFVIT